MTGSVAGPSVVSGSVVGGTALLEPSLGLGGHGLGLGGLGLGLGLGHGLGLGGLGLGHNGLVGYGGVHGAAIAGPHSLPALIAGPSGSILAGGYGGHGGIYSGYLGH